MLFPRGHCWSGWLEPLVPSQLATWPVPFRAKKHYVHIWVQVCLFPLPTVCPRASPFPVPESSLPTRNWGLSMPSLQGLVDFRELAQVPGTKTTQPAYRVSPSAPEGRGHGGGDIVLELRARLRTISWKWTQSLKIPFFSTL